MHFIIYYLDHVFMKCILLSVIWIKKQLFLVYTCNSLNNLKKKTIIWYEDIW